MEIHNITAQSPFEKELSYWNWLLSRKWYRKIDLSTINHTALAWNSLSAHLNTSPLCFRVCVCVCVCVGRGRWMENIRKR